MNPNKVTGSDGLSAAFYQTQWDIVGDSTTQLIQEAFRKGQIPTEINTTLLVLIPKQSSPSSLSPTQTNQPVYSLI